MKPQAEPKNGIRCESEVGCRPGRRKGHTAQAGWNETVGRKPDGTGSSSASLMDRQRSIGSAEQSTRVGGLQPVEPKDTKPIRAGRLATGRAGVQAADASRRLCAGAARGSSASESWRAATGGAGGRSTGCTAESSRGRETAWNETDRADVTRRHSAGWWVVCSFSLIFGQC